MCQVCAAVFRDGIGDLPDCPSCDGEAKIAERQDKQRSALFGTKPKAKKTVFDEYSSGYKKGLVQDHQLFAEIEEQAGSKNIN